MPLASRVASAGAKLALSQASVRLLSLVTMPLLTHLLAPAAYGIWALMGTVVSLAAMVAIAGMDMSYMRTCTGTVGQASRAAEAFAWQFALLSALTAGLAAAAVWFLIAPSFAVPQYLTGFVLLAVPFSVAGTMAQTRARLQERYWSLSFAIFIAGLLGALILRSLDSRAFRGTDLGRNIFRGVQRRDHGHDGQRRCACGLDTGDRAGIRG